MHVNWYPGTRVPGTRVPELSKVRKERHTKRLDAELAQAEDIVQWFTRGCKEEEEEEEEEEL